MNAAPRRRRAAIVTLAVVVSLGHWLAMQWLAEMRIGDGRADRMPKRIEVAFVRELAPAAPPAVAPVPVARPKPASRKVPVKPAEPASAPQIGRAHV